MGRKRQRVKDTSMATDLLFQILDQLRSVHETYSNELSKMPEGKLLHARTKYYLIVRANGAEIRHGITKDQDKVRLLARKELLLKAVPIIESNIKLIEQAVKNYIPCNPHDIHQQLTRAFRSMPIELFLNKKNDATAMRLDSQTQSRIDSHKDWDNAGYTPSDYKSDGRTIRTTRGLLVRSKSEALIAEKLYEYGIPFRYEQPLDLDDGTLVHPDFTFEGAGGSLFYLEFCGMMDDLDYVSSYKRKRALYEASGITEWTNMIYVFASGNSIDMMYVEDVVQNQIIPRL